MRFPKLLPLIFLLMVPSALAQVSGLSQFGSIMGGVFGGIFNGISSNPAVWMKVILIIILYIILYIAVLPKSFSHLKQHAGGRNILALVLAIGMIAPIPAAIIETLFVSLQFMGLVFYIAPVLGMMYLTYNITSGRKNVAPKHRTPYAVALILWILTLFGYINGLGFAVGVENIPKLALTAGIMNFVAVIAIIYFAIKLLTVSGAASVAEGYTDWFNRGGPAGTPPGSNPPNAPDEEAGEDVGGKKGKSGKEKSTSGAHGEDALDTTHAYSFWKPSTWFKSKQLKKTLGVIDDYLGRLKMVLEDLQTLLSRGTSNDQNAAVKNNPNVQILLNDVTAATAILSRVDVVKKDATLKTLLGQMEKTASDLSTSIDKGLSPEQTLLLYKYFGRGGIADQVYNRIAALFKKDVKQTQDEIMAQQILLKREEDRARQSAEAAKKSTAPVKAVGSAAYALWRMGGMNPFTWNWNQPPQRSIDDLMASLVAITAKMKGSPNELLSDGRVYTLLSAVLISGIAGEWLNQARQRADELYHVRTAADRGTIVPEVMLERVRSRIYQFAEAWTRRRESA